jgi:hypothetical protein
VALVCEQTIPTERTPLVGEVSANLADRGCHVVSVTDPYCRILGFLDRGMNNVILLYYVNFCHAFDVLTIAKLI